MKRIIRQSLLLAAGILAFLPATSCQKDDPVDPDKNGVKEDGMKVDGAIVVCNGAAYLSIPGSVTTYNFADKTVTLNAFAEANARSLGVSANSATVYGDYLYIVSTEENTIEITEKGTLKSVATIRTEEMFGTDKGHNPRRAVGHDGKIYFTTFSGYVCVYDCESGKAESSISCGSYPEGLAFDSNGNLWVANSGYGMGVDPSVAKINPSTGDVTQITSDEIHNPDTILIFGSRVFLLDSGYYDTATWNQNDAALYEITGGDTLAKIHDATMAAAGSDMIFLCNAPFHTPVLTPQYFIFSLSDNTVKPLDISVDSPAFIGVNKVNNDLFIGSYTIDEATHYANYGSNGYVRVFNGETKLYDFECGVGPTAITFN